MPSALQTADADGVYKSMEDLFSNTHLAIEDSAMALHAAAGPHLTLICDTKFAGSETYFRLNDSKVCQSSLGLPSTTLTSR